MNKRSFLKSSGSLLAGGMFSRLFAVEERGGVRKNWAGNYTYRAKRVYLPKTVDEVQQIVKRATHLKALGARHSFNPIADSSESQISLQHFNRIALNTRAHTVTVGAGVSYGRLGPYLDKRGYALHNLASLPQITAAGACATGTHGSGSRNGNLSTAVSAMEIVTANGDLLSLERHRDDGRFLGSVVHLGGLGIVTSITLDVRPTFQISQVVYQNLSFNELKSHLDDIFSSAYSVSLFTDWQNHRAGEVWLKRRVERGASSSAPPTFFGATLAHKKLHPILGHSASACTEQLGIPGPWYDRLPHFKMNATPSSGHELQTEYFVPLDRAYEAILAVESLRDEITPHLFVTELRTIAADDLWMSPCYERPSMTIHFTWKPETEAVQRLLPRIEEKLAPFHPRPHWAKVFTIPPGRVRSLYPKLSDFQALLRQHDPEGKFRNDFLDRNIFGA